MDRILGIDFSGARDAGQKIWLTVCVERDGQLHVKSSVPAGSQFDAGTRSECLEGVRAAIERADIVGLDCPFGIPTAVHDCTEWVEVVAWVAEFEGPRELQRTCAQRGAEATDDEWTYLRRTTDEARGALSPYHWIGAARTYYGITEVLQPLVEADSVAVQPLSEGSGTPVCEVYPPATLRDIGLPTQGYRDNVESAREKRETIVEGLRMTPLALHGIEEHLVEDVGGDAIDSLLSALAAWRASRAEFTPDGPFEPDEGYIYV